MLERSDAGHLGAASVTFDERWPSGNALIAVVNDQIAIQQAMHSLLSAWGHRVVVAGSAKELIDFLPRAGPAPDLVICDYRLRGGENGLGVIATLRGHFVDTIPAILITGDTAPGRIVEAAASGLLLLYKPLTNARLRAAVGNLLRQRRDGATEPSMAQAVEDADR